jgi:hypothetical protein
VTPSPPAPPPSFRIVWATVKNNIFLGETYSSVYIFGGRNNFAPYAIVDSVSYFNISRDGMLLDSSLSVTTMPQPRRDHCSVGYAGSFVFIIGGQTTGPSMMTSLLFNTKSLTFVDVFSLSQPRLNPTCNTIGMKIVIAGGLMPNG